MQKTLIVYYSRTGRTKTVAQALAKSLHADLEEIYEVKSRKGIWGWLSGGRDAFRKTLTKILKSHKNPQDYELVIMGTPVWSWTMVPGIRSWLTQYADDLHQVAFFATMSGSGDQRTFKQMTEICHKSPLAVMSFIDKKIDQGEYTAKLNDFIAALKK